ncbi:hypothetical protein [Parvibaculum sp.]|uniref:hypothetical protein n=1 Tax=Parvibaculum sp. TaxID=2024848 RepID=UPI0025F2E277|nr:hypothetical protein [Parvibaculum sp.]
MRTLGIVAAGLVAVIVVAFAVHVSAYDQWSCAPAVRAMGLASKSSAGDMQCELEKLDIAGLPPSELYALGNDYMQRKKPNMSLVLWEEGWRKGHGPSARAIGEMLDPNLWGTQPSAFTKPNAQDSRKWYERAVKNGDVSAQARLAALPAQ